MPLLLLTCDMVCLQALVVVQVEIFSVPFVVAAYTLVTRFTAASNFWGWHRWLASSRVVCCFRLEAELELKL